jgi:hypothetical protein
VPVRLLVSEGDGTYLQNAKCARLRLLINMHMERQKPPRPSSVSFNQVGRYSLRFPTVLILAEARLPFEILPPDKS